MQMTDVRSSNVAAIGYDPDCCVLAVRYRDGRLYVAANIHPDQHAALMASESKGGWLAQRFHGKEVTPKTQTEPRRGGETSTIATTSAAPLTTHDEDACCGKYLDRALRAGQLQDAESWACPRCGETWQPETVGTVRHWRMKPSLVIFCREGR